MASYLIFFFFQAEDGIRYRTVTGVQTCALPISAIDLKTLSEAARSLGAGWATVMLRVVMPNMSTAILNASLLSVALVLGEYTFANLLAYENLQVAIAYVGLVDAGTSIAVAVASFMFAFVLLLILSYLGRRQAPFAQAATADYDLAQTVGLSGGVIGRAGRSLAATEAKRRGRGSRSVSRTCGARTARRPRS